MTACTAYTLKSHNIAAIIYDTTVCIDQGQIYLFLMSSIPISLIQGNGKLLSRYGFRFLVTPVGTSIS